MSWIQLELHIIYRQLHLIGDEADWGTFTLLAACAEHKFKKILTKGINTYKQRSVLFEVSTNIGKRKVDPHT
ncbi:hypothetical protein POPTR_010G129867v4 [Populus trichocarpa]|uniref:Uncharacterized protein n=1 Tax=Populus trichocarpa TaxID=3694 RepID=A0ACC0SD65_POPTR|nr:hypothetical protein POPTR_010G129867v4 [Populus trichocarpa]